MRSQYLSPVPPKYHTKPVSPYLVRTKRKKKSKMLRQVPQACTDCIVVVSLWQLYFRAQKTCEWIICSKYMVITMNRVITVNYLHFIWRQWHFKLLCQRRENQVMKSTESKIYVRQAAGNFGFILNHLIPNDWLDITRWYAAFLTGNLRFTLSAGMWSV